MRSFYAQFWPWHSSASLRKAIIVSIVLHVSLVAFLTVRFPQRLQLTQAGSYSVELVNPNAPPADAPPLGVPDAEPPKEVKPPAPPPPPKKEEPKPKEPEPKKEVKPKAKVETVKEEKPKPEKPKEEKPKKETPKEEPKKKEEERTKVVKNEKPRPISDNPMDDAPSPLDDLSPMDDVSNQPSRPTRQPAQQTRGVPTGKAGLSMAGGIPSALGAWGGNVQRKVEAEWKIPEGIVLGPLDDGAMISFWVSRDGQLLGEPKVEKHAVDPEVAASAIRAIRSAVPYPRLPDSFGDAEVQVFYTFIPTK